MITSHRLRLVEVAALTLGIGLPACGGGDMQMMSTYSSLFTQHANTYQSELDQHRADVEASGGASEIAALETGYLSRSQMSVNTMRHDVDDMMGCTGPGGERPNSQDVVGDLDRIQQAGDDHRGMMERTTTVPAARNEEARYQNQMTGLLGGLRTNAATMMEGRSHYTCSHHMYGVGLSSARFATGTIG